MENTYFVYRLRDASHTNTLHAKVSVMSHGRFMYSFFFFVGFLACLKWAGLRVVPCTNQEPTTSESESDNVVFLFGHCQLNLIKPHPRRLGDFFFLIV